MEKDLTSLIQTQKEPVVAAKVLPFKNSIIILRTAYCRTGFLFLLFTFTQTVNAQYVYRYKTPADPAITLGSGIVITGSMLLQKKYNRIDTTFLKNLNPKNLPAFDRPAVYNYNRSIAKASDYLALSSGILYSYYVLHPDTRKESPYIINTAMQSVLISQALCNLFKLSGRARPYLYNSEVPLNERMKHDGRNSFFSAHTSTVSALSFSFAYSWSVYKPDKPGKYFVYSAAAILPAVEACLRVKAGKHFPSDVITGYLAGFASSFLMHSLHKKLK